MGAFTFWKEWMGFGLGDSWGVGGEVGRELLIEGKMKLKKINE